MERTAALPGALVECSVSSFSVTALSQPQKMKTAVMRPALSASKGISNGLS